MLKPITQIYHLDEGIFLSYHISNKGYSDISTYDFILDGQFIPYNKYKNLKANTLKVFTNKPCNLDDVAKLKAFQRYKLMYNN